LKQSLIIGSALLLGAAALFGWTYYDQKIKEPARQQLSQKSQASLDKISEILGDRVDSGILNDAIYEKELLKNIEEQRKREETRGLILTFSGVLGLSGAAVLALSFLVVAARFVGRLCSVSARFLVGRLFQANTCPQTAPVENTGSENTGSMKERKGGGEKGSPTRPGPFARRDIPKSTDADAALERSGWTALNKKALYTPEGAASQPTKPAECRVSDASAAPVSAKKGSRGPLAGKAHSETEPEKSVSRGTATAVLTREKESVKAGQKADSGAKQARAEKSSEGGSEDLNKLLKARTEELEKTMAQFKQMASQSQRTGEPSKPLQESIRELSCQISAIREYAAHQQERIKKLQDGYDWGIIKNFCLRIIRCIDNLEGRINEKLESKADVTDLEEIRDELIFALESTGVEKFEPEINSDYRGQERNTEAIREKEHCEDPSLKGKIARVIRPGYRYCVDEDNMKIVRTAQVKLYE